MIVAIMQPYFFPYLGYWQIMNAADRYVVYDDVNFIKGGRINRNAILMNGQAHNINVPLIGASPNKKINEITVNPDSILREKLVRSIEQSYTRAPYYDSVMPLLREAIRNEEETLGNYLFRTFLFVGSYLGIETEWILSSQMEKDCSLKGKDKVLQICKILGADTYYNSISGVPLYEPYRPLFEEAGIELKFPKMRAVHYPQFHNDFVPNLSIIDVMMFNSQEVCRRLLHEYDFAGQEERDHILREHGIQ